MDAARQFNYKPDQVMQITQDLREKYKLITYNGTDCQYLNEEQHTDAPGVLLAIAQTATQYSGLIDVADADIKSRAFNNKNVSAHHAIIPTEAIADIDELTEPQRNIYLLIAKVYIAQFYPKHQYRDTLVSITCEDHRFGVRSKTTTNDGWRTLFNQQDNTDEDQPDGDDNVLDNDLSVLKNGDNGYCDQASVFDKETKPQPLYTMATLLSDLTRVAKYIKNPKIKKLLIEKDKEKKGEHGGIGTSRTRDQIIKKLFDIGFLSEKGKKIISTDIGKQFHGLLPEIATRPHMTALWHEQQSAIEQDKYTADDFIDNLMKFITQQVDKVKNEGLSIKVETIDCPECKEGHLKKRKGSKGIFWACSAYPECNFTVPNKAGKPDFKSLETHPCPSCEKPMKRRKGSSGFFWGCTGYPDCSQTLPDKRGKPDTKAKEKPKVEASDEFMCGECSKPLARRPSKKSGGHWWGCTGFPNCKKTYKDLSGSPDYNS